MIDDKRDDVLTALAKLLHGIGSANNAEDHGFLDEADRLRGEACEAIRSLLAGHGFLADLFPTLQWEVDSGHILGFGWVLLLEELEARQGNPDTVSSECPGVAAGRTDDGDGGREAGHRERV